jgi:mannose-6-phosphate isomerase-like protein (cupin superfamily)
MLPDKLWVLSAEDLVSKDQSGDKEPALLDRAEWSEDTEKWQGEFEGIRFGTNVSVMFYTTDEVGHGPKLHRHPYDEVFIVREGRAMFMVGKQTLEAAAGQIVFGPANIPHKYFNMGPGRLEMTDLHVTDIFVQEDLE